MSTALQALVAPDHDRRTALRRFLEVRGVVGQFQRPHVETQLLADDGVRLAATYLPGPVWDAPAVVLLHGFGAHRRKPSYAYLADALSLGCHVLTLDLRGHGRSGGACTLGDRERLDADAAVRWMRAYGHRWVALVGFSMGGTAALHALHKGIDADAAVVVSTPAWLRSTHRTPAMRFLDEVWRSPLKRAAMRVSTGIRVVAPERWQAPPHPAEAAARIDRPLLVVHGEDDHFFGPEDGDAIATAAEATLWREPPGFGHAEDGLRPAFVGALTESLAAAYRHGHFPPRDEVAR
ncbi:MAG: lysophospholipase [Actinobacteria bacterium]|nr:lysophospholipase [Actinomycetota bacterium]